MPRAYASDESKGQLYIHVFIVICATPQQAAPQCTCGRATTTDTNCALRVILTATELLTARPKLLSAPS